MIVFILNMLFLSTLWLYCAFIISDEILKEEEEEQEERDDNDGKIL